MLSSAAMRIFLWGFAILLTSAGGLWAAGRAADSSRWQQRRQRAAVAFSDGVLLVHAEVPGDLASDGFRQDPIFYYFTGLENTADAVLAIDGPSKESWLFLSPAVPSPFSFLGLKPEVLPGPETVKRGTNLSKRNPFAWRNDGKKSVVLKRNLLSPIPV